MKQNESSMDRIVRVIVGLVLVWLGWFYLGNNTLGIVLDILGAVAVFTGLTGFCLLYKVFGNFTTKK